MANFTVTITNSIRAFGPAPSTKWGTGTPYNMTWGTSKWGEGTEDLIASLLKVIGNAIGSDSAQAISAGFNRTLSNSVSVASDLGSESLGDGTGYSFVFPGNATNAEDRVISNYNTAAAGSTTYSSGTAGTTTWS